MSLPSLTLGVGHRSEAKTRVFSVRLMGYLLADSLWESSRSGSMLQPAWIAYLGTDQESRAFTANFRAGRKAKAEGDVFALPKRSPHRWRVQRVPEAAITVAYLPELFHLDPVVPEGERVSFVFAPPLSWLREQAAALAEEFRDDAEDAARAALFAAYLDRRTHLPLVHDLRFHLQLYRAALDAEWLHRPVSSPWGGGVLVARGMASCGLDLPLACAVRHQELAEFVVAQTSTFHHEEIRRGTTRFATDRRLLPYPTEPAGQLRLDFAVA